MSIVNLQVKITKIQIKTNNNNAICFSLRLGRVLSNLSTAVTNNNQSEIQPDLNLAIGCQESVLKINTRASLVIYEVESQQKRNIIGMVFILLKEQQSEVRRYKIHQSNDPNSYAELSFCITAIQLKQKQNQSMASKSSLADIRQLHHALNRGHKKTGSDASCQSDQKKKNYVSHQDKQRELKNRNTNSHKNFHLKSQQSPFDNGEDPSYAILLKKAEDQLSKQRERTSLLTNLLVIEQQKNNQSENFIKNMIKSLESLTDTRSPEQQYEFEQSNLQKLALQIKRSHEQQKNKQNKKDSRQNNNSLNIQTVIKQRDQLYSISQQLYDKTKLYKLQNENLYKSSKSLQNELKLYLKQIDDLRFQNNQLKKRIDYEQNYRKQNISSNFLDKYRQVVEQNQKLKKENMEYQRKFKESYKAIQEFKNDAWKAQEEVIKKEQQIIALKQDLQTFRTANYHLSQQGGSSYNQDQKQSNSPQQIFKLMSSLLIKNNIQRQQMLQKLNQNKSRNNQQQDILKSNYNLTKTIKQKIDKLYFQLKNENKMTINILQMKRRVIEVINSIDL